MEFNSNIADILAFSSGFIRKNQKSSSKMEFDSRLDEKAERDCPKYKTATRDTAISILFSKIF